ncbi:hypothetical protein GQ457_08G019660 [Hibiscus cannabinus]
MSYCIVKSTLLQPTFLDLSCHSKLINPHYWLIFHPRPLLLIQFAEENMQKFQASLLLLLVVMMWVSAARPLPVLPDQQRYWKMLGSLGVVCECCDGSEGECSATWTQPCSKLKCLPWKLH